MKKIGYIGKSFAMGSVGILASVIAACGGGGVTDVVASSATPSAFVAFAMGYEPHPSTQGDLKWQTLQGGDVYMGSAGYAYGNFGIWDAAAISYHQSVGIQFFHSAPLATTDYIYTKIQAPEDGSVDASATSTMLIQMGNDKIGGEANTATVFTVSIEGGDYDTTTYSYANSCKTNVTLDQTPNPNMLHTYSLLLASLTCDSGTVDAAKSDLRAVTVKVLASENATSAATTTANYVLPKVATVVFTK
jgi:hypothetical protein